MARYTGPNCRICRRFGMKLYLKGERCFGPKCGVERRRYPPGEHGQGRHKVSEYGLQLGEKQKLRYIYGVLETQFRRHFAEADRLPGMTGPNLLSLLERRLDNVVYRLGFASSRDQARQLVRHGHFEVNGRKTDIPSAIVREGDDIAVRQRIRDSEYFAVTKEGLTEKSVPAWLVLNRENLSGHVARLPERDDIDTPVNEQLVVEYYSR
jgi:small subunit ribosomal protein S4